MLSQRVLVDTHKEKSQLLRALKEVLFCAHKEESYFKFKGRFFLLQARLLCDLFLLFQDFTWGYALLTTGLMILLLVILYGAEKFRCVIINDFGLRDWYVPRAWDLVYQVSEEPPLSKKKNC